MLSALPCPCFLITECPHYLSSLVFFCLNDSRWFALCCGGAGAGEEPAAGADTESGGALSGPGGSTTAASTHRDITGNLTNSTNTLSNSPWVELNQSVLLHIVLPSHCEDITYLRTLR